MGKLSLSRSWKEWKRILSMNKNSFPSYCSFWLLKGMLSPDQASLSDALKRALSH
jgi:hypothetical protein